MLKILSAEETTQPHQKGDLGGVSNGGWSNACPDELHEDDGEKYWIYLSHDYYGHGGIDKTKGTQEYATYHIQNTSDKYWDLVYPIVT